MGKLHIHASIIEDAAREQIERLKNSAAYKGCDIAVMPDVHAGKGCTVGTVIKTNGRIVPNTVGVDIGCGMHVVKFKARDIDFKMLDNAIKQCIPSGKYVHDWLDVPMPSQIVHEATKLMENLYIPIDTEEYLYYMCSLGTLGGGNHFIEIDKGSDGSMYIVIHTGSRKLGVDVCKYWQKVADKRKTFDADAFISDLKSETGISIEVRERNEIPMALKQQGLHKRINEIMQRSLKYVHDFGELNYIDGRDAEQYINDALCATRFAELNRYVIALRLKSALGIKGPDVIDEFETIHNYVDNFGIIRKGAISCGAGERVIIPMNMRDGSLLCVGRGNEDWLCSGPHGAGRVMSRVKAHAELSVDDFNNDMKGIFTTTANETTIDESPRAYKPYETIMCDVSDTVDVIERIVPMYNFKASE